MKTVRDLILWIDHSAIDWYGEDLVCIINKKIRNKAAYIPSEYENAIKEFRDMDEDLSLDLIDKIINTKSNINILNSKIFKFNLKDYIKGWFIGNFDPSIIKTNDVEVGIKRYKSGDFEALHYHKVATEVTTIVSGEVEMNGIKYVADDIIVIHPYEKTDFKCLTDVVTVVVKYPGANNDKYID